MDTGPLVASFCPRDEHFAWARRAFAQVAPGAIVCEAVLTEVCYLVSKEGVPRAKVIEFVRHGRFSTVSLSDELEPIQTLLARYADTPMDFADACVVRLSELCPQATVCTTDGHFRFFRKHGQEVIPLLAPFGP